MLYCPWCQAEFEDEMFCLECGRPVALKAQPGVRIMLETGVINEKIVETAQRRLISKVRQQHVSQIREGVLETNREGGEFAREERDRLMLQGADLKERFQQFKEQAVEGSYAPEEHR